MPKNPNNQPPMIDERGPLVDAMPYDPGITPEQATADNDRAQAEILSGHPAPTEKDKQVGRSALKGMREQLDKIHPNAEA